MGLVFGLIFRFGPESFTFIHERFVGFLTAALTLSVLQALCCYISSFWGNKLLALGGNTGNPIYDVRLNLLKSIYLIINLFIVLHR